MKFLLIVLSLLFALTGCTKKENIENNTVNNNRITTNTITSNEVVVDNTPQAPSEEELYAFSTTIYIKEEERQNNITLACQELNESIVKNGDTFSFCETLGPATPQEGYEKADTFDSDGDLYKEYGGGKCQISSTLYNAVMNIPGIEIVERHPHSGKVDYVEEGKDAAVAYGSVDFKFTNNTGADLKIYSSNTEDSVDIRIVKIS